MSKCDFSVWPWNRVIWPWGQKFKIPPPKPPAGCLDACFCAISSPSYQNCRRSLQKHGKPAKNANDPCDLGFDLVTLRVLHVLELDYTYLQTKYEQDRTILRVWKCNFTVWPWNRVIWPWGQKFKIPPPKPPAGSLDTCFCAISSPSYQNCRRSSQKR